MVIKKNFINRFFLSLITLLLLSNIALASETDGTIDSINKYAWSENSGWINFGNTNGNVHVTDSGLTGYAWSANHGWINLNPSGSGVENNGEGTLSGSAWGENTGWIDFTGVTIDSDGYFHGYGSGTVTGQISFNCANTSSCASSDFKVITDWRPQSARVTEQSVSVEEPAVYGGGAGGGNAIQSNDKSGLSAGATEEVTEKNTSNECNHSFADISGHWSEDNIVFLACKKIISGKNPELFEPDSNATRAEVTKIALLMSERGIDEDIPGFEDVNEDHWAYHIIGAGEKAGIIHGYADGFFRPDRTITRAEALKVLLYAAGFEVPEDKSLNFPDVFEYAWYVDVVNYGFELDIIEGYEDGFFRPDKNITRGEIAKIARLIYEII